MSDFPSITELIDLDVLEVNNMPPLKHIYECSLAEIPEGWPALCGHRLPPNPPPSARYPQDAHRFRVCRACEEQA